MVAAFIIIVAIVGIFGLVSRITAITTYSIDRLTAAYLAQEGLEIVRNIRDSNWLASLSWNENLICPAGCEADYQSQALTDSYDGDFLKIDGGFYQYSSGSNSKFKRKITVSQSEADVLEVIVEVFWETNKIVAKEKLYRWWK